MFISCFTSDLGEVKYSSISVFHPCLQVSYFQRLIGRADGTLHLGQRIVKGEVSHAIKLSAFEERFLDFVLEEVQLGHFIKEIMNFSYLHFPGICSTLI